MPRNCLKLAGGEFFCIDVIVAVTRQIPSLQGKQNSSFSYPQHTFFHDDKSAFGSSIVQGRLVAVPVGQAQPCAFGDE
jgi:hypothetical protein